MGSWVARIITQLGCRLIAVANTSGAIHAEAGLDPDSLLQHLQDGGKLIDYPDAAPRSGAERISPEALIGLDCEVLIPAALGGVLHAANADSVRARAVIEGANNPTTPAADDILDDKGIVVVPDILANSGGVIVSYFEWAQNLQHVSWDEHEVNNRLGMRMRQAYREVEHRAQAGSITMRQAAYELGIERVVEAGRLRGRRGYGP